MGQANTHSEQRMQLRISRRAVSRQLQFHCRVWGEEFLPCDGRKLIFVSNHPRGAVEAICIAYVLGHKYEGKIRFYANEFLSVLEPLKELFLPIYKHGQQSKDNLRLIREFYESDQHLISFPAGVTSYQSKGKVLDHAWHKNFISSAIRHQRDVVPLL